MLRISRTSEVNIINMLIDHSLISSKDLSKIKKISAEKDKSQLEAVFDLKLTDEEKILNILNKEQSLAVVDLKTKTPPSEEVSKILPINYVYQNFIAPFELNDRVLHIAIPDSSKLSLMRNLKTITKKDIELHAAKISEISNYIKELEKFIETKVASISTSPERKDTILIIDPFSN